MYPQYVKDLCTPFDWNCAAKIGKLFKTSKKK